MSQKNYKDLEAEIILERIENKPKTGEITKGTILVKNSRGLYIDIAKCFEGFIASQELGSKSLDEFKVGEQIEFLVQGEDKNQDGVYRLSLREIEQKQKWQDLEALKNQNLDLSITKVLKSGVEVRINQLGVIGFVPFVYLDNRDEALKTTAREQWTGLHIIGRIHELEESKNKIILNHKIICDELRATKADEIINSLAIGSELEVEVVRLADFGVFVDLGGFDALIPSSELSWRRFRKPSEVIKVGDKVKAKVFKIEKEQKRIALSVKQANPDPWTILPEEVKVGYKAKAKVVSQAEFGAFVELLPGVEALLHKSNYSEENKPELGAELDVEIINLEAAKKRMGVKLNASSKENPTESQSQEETKELEHV